MQRMDLEWAENTVQIVADGVGEDDVEKQDEIVGGGIRVFGMLLVDIAFSLRQIADTLYGETNQ